MRSGSTGSAAKLYTRHPGSSLRVAACTGADAATIASRRDGSVRRMAASTTIRPTGSASGMAVNVVRWTRRSGPSPTGRPPSKGGDRQGRQLLLTGPLELLLARDL